MSGIAIVIPGADFSAKNLEKVTFLEDVAVTGITINGALAAEGMTSLYTVTYHPANTSQKGCVWSVESGSEYASIDASTGVLTIKSGASANNVVIRVTSTYDSAVTVTKTVTVTYKETVDELTGISIIGESEVGLDGSPFSISYPPENTSRKGVVWSVVSGSQYASIDRDGYLTVVADGSVTIKAVSVCDNSITATKTITTTSFVPAIFLSINNDERGVLTDIVVADISSAEMEVLLMTRDAGNFAIGSRTSGSANDRFGIIPGITLKSGYWNALFGNASLGDVNFPLSKPSSANIFKVGREGASLNGTMVQYTSTPDISSSNTAPFAIGNFFNNGTKSWHFEKRSTSGSARVAYVRIKENGVLTHNLKPYKDGSDFGFTDIVTGRKYSASSLVGASYVENLYAS